MDDIKAARLALKWKLEQEWPRLRCPCGEYGATDLGHVVYTRHPDSVELYHPYNMALMHNSCNIQERLWVNVSACVILLERADRASELGGIDEWERWARALSRKGEYWIPEKMRIAMVLWEQGVRAFEVDKIKDAL